MNRERPLTATNGASRGNPELRLRERVQTSTVSIREATSEDLEAITHLRLAFLAAHRRADAAIFSPEFLHQTRDFLRRHIDSGSIRSWLADADGEHIGAVSMLILDLAPRPEDRSGREGYIINMYVDPGHRRQGIGRSLLERCLADASELRLRRLLLYTTDDGRPLYTELGFTPNPNWMELPL